MPVGLYLLDPSTVIHHGDVVVARLAPATRALADRRRYVPAVVPVIKPVAAIGGDRVCAHAGTIVINGVIVAQRLAADSKGRALPAWTGCRVLGRSDVFLLATHRADSFDGRYFGPVPRSNIMGVARLIWRK